MLTFWQNLCTFFIFRKPTVDTSSAIQINKTENHTMTHSKHLWGYTERKHREHHRPESAAAISLGWNVLRSLFPYSLSLHSTNSSLSVQSGQRQCDFVSYVKNVQGHPNAACWNHKSSNVLRKWFSTNSLAHMQYSWNDWLRSEVWHKQVWDIVLFSCNDLWWLLEQKHKCLCLRTI
jgi:hypothetical protein